MRTIFLSWSSGKDGVWALRAPRADSSVEVAGLLTTINQRFAYAGPMFERPLSIVRGKNVEHDGFVFSDILPA